MADVAAVCAKVPRGPVRLACRQCGGARVVLDGNAGLGPCSACCCTVCGEPTDTPPECGECWTAEDVAAERRADR